MNLKKCNALLGLLSIVCILIHIGYTIITFLTYYYNPMLKMLTAVPFMVLVCLHAIYGMLTVFLRADGTRLDLYPKQNIEIILQRVSAALILPMLILHINTFELLQAAAEKGQWIWFWLLLISQPMFYAIVLTHISVSVTRAFITLGWLGSQEKKKKIDRIIYILCAAAFVIAAFVVLRTELAMFLLQGGMS